jgi:hypothetical protein
MSAQLLKRSKSTSAIVAIALGVLLSSCGDEGEQKAPSGTTAQHDKHKTTSETTARYSEASDEFSDEAAQLADVATRRLTSTGDNLKAIAKREGRELASSLAGYCDLEKLFWGLAAGHAASPLIDTKRNNTFLALVGVFETEPAASNAYPSLVSPAQRACYRALVRKLLVNQVGKKAATGSDVRVARQGQSSSDALTLEVRTKVHYPTETYKKKVYPGRDRYTEARLGFLRKGRIIYFISNFRWDRSPSNSLKLFRKVVAS